MTLLLPITLLLLATRSSSSFSNSKSIISSGRNAILKMSSTPMTATSPSTSPTTTKRIFCYGDSLTAGTTYPSDELYPYGIHLEEELNRCMLPPNLSYSSASMSELPAVVRWRGLPGWTASAMADCMGDPNAGLKSVLYGIRDPSLSLVIILVGTNDIGSLTSSMGFNSNKDVDAASAVGPILRLHEACLECDGDDGTRDVRTLAVGVPGSAWQEANPKAFKLCTDVNQALRTFASGQDRVSYVDFPFPYRRGDSKWSGDGLHLSPEGYETLGRGLARCVKQILDRI